MVQHRPCPQGHQQVDDYNEQKWWRYSCFSIDCVTQEGFSSVQSLSCVQVFATPMEQSMPGFLVTNSQSLLTLMSFELVMSCNHLILGCPLLLPLSIFPSIRVFQMSQFFTSGGQSIGASASVLPVNIQDWFPLGLTGWISLQSKGLSRVFSNIQFKSINTLVLSFLYGPTLTSIHDHWKDHSLD